MALRTKVKVGRITNLSDARYCAGMGVDMLGFSISGPNSISFEKFKEINGWVTGPQLVLEINSVEDVGQAVSAFYATCLEIKAEWVSQLNIKKDISLIVRIDLNRGYDISLSDSFKENILHVLVENYNKENKPALMEIADKFSVLIEINDSSLNPDELLQLPIAGIALKGSEELRPGLKDYNQLSEILEKLDVD
jgi:phosphoribosylanthranilate isomerase